MTHKVLSPRDCSLDIDYKYILNDDLINKIENYSVVLINLPRLQSPAHIKNPQALIDSPIWQWTKAINLISNYLRKETNLLIYCETEITPYIYAYLAKKIKYQTWIEIKLNKPNYRLSKSLPIEHIGLFVTTVGDLPLQHNKIRIAYEYCPACGKTTKDYGGRKHLYDAFGTLMSDVWKDLDINWDVDLPQPVIERIRDMFCLFPDGKMLVLYLDKVEIELPNQDPNLAFPKIPEAPIHRDEQIFKGIEAGDCLDLLPQVPSESISLAFADPPYNLAKNYNSYTDSRDISDYLRWTDKWLSQYVRVLKPGGILVVMNLPILCIRHFLLLEQFQELTRLNWIVWDALSAPRRLIMPANYSILVYAKQIESTQINLPESQLLFSDENQILYPIADGYCLRANCVKNRMRVNKSLTDLWTDIYRVKHNSKRLDHPCLLPPKLMERLIILFSQTGDIVLDAFNGVGTTSLTAHMLNRGFIGFDTDSEYCEIASNRHKLIDQRKDPFSIGAGEQGLKNDGSKRMENIHYEVPKKTIQLAVKQLGIKLNRIPTPDDVKKHLPDYWKYCNEYFANWSEVTRACFTTGMSENPPAKEDEEAPTQLTMGL